MPLPDAVENREPGYRETERNPFTTRAPLSSLPLARLRERCTYRGGTIISNEPRWLRNPKPIRAGYSVTRTVGARSTYKRETLPRRATNGSSAHSTNQRATMPGRSTANVRTLCVPEVTENRRSLDERAASPQRPKPTPCRPWWGLVGEMGRPLLNSMRVAETFPISSTSYL